MLALQSWTLLATVRHHLHSTAHCCRSILSDVAFKPSLGRHDLEWHALFHASCSIAGLKAINSKQPACRVAIGMRAAAPARSGGRMLPIRGGRRRPLRQARGVGGLLRLPAPVTILLLGVAASGDPDTVSRVPIYADVGTPNSLVCGYTRKVDVNSVVEVFR